MATPMEGEFSWSLPPLPTLPAQTGRMRPNGGMLRWQRQVAAGRALSGIPYVIGHDGMEAVPHGPTQKSL